MLFSNSNLISFVLRGVTICLMGIALAGCIPNPPREVIFNEGGPTMSQIYRGQNQSRAVRQEVGYSNPASKPGTEDYTRDAGNEIDFLFPELENPRLVMFVFPHTSENGHPIPGYATAFYLYDTTQHFALPGEVLH